MKETVYTRLLLSSTLEERQSSSLRDGPNKKPSIFQREYKWKREMSMEDWMLLGRFVPWQSMVNHSWLYLVIC